MVRSAWWTMWFVLLAGCVPAGSTDTDRPLREVVAGSGRMIGVALYSPAFDSERRLGDVVVREFDALVPGNETNWHWIHPEPDRWNFAGGDRLAAFARDHGMKFKGGHLVYHGILPSWAERLEPEALRAAVAGHVTALVQHYQGQAVAWNVVNEAIADEGSGLRDSTLSRKLGPDFIAEAFRTARVADPTAQLVYNDYAAEGLGPKSDAVYALVKGLVESRVPIDAVGLQFHIFGPYVPDLADVRANVKRLAALGLKVKLTELDVTLATAPADFRLAQQFERQRRLYHDVVQICVEEPACDEVTLWGFTDSWPWVDGLFGPGHYPGILDAEYRRKPAYYGVRDALSGE